MQHHVTSCPVLFQSVQYRHVLSCQLLTCSCRLHVTLLSCSCRSLVMFLSCFSRVLVMYLSRSCSCAPMPCPVLFERYPEHPFPVMHPILWQHLIKSFLKHILAFCAREERKKWHYNACQITQSFHTKKYFCETSSSREMCCWAHWLSWLCCAVVVL